MKWYSQTLLLLLENADNSIHNDEYGIYTNTLKSLTNSFMTTADCILMMLFRPANPDQLNPVLIQILTIQMLVYSPQVWWVVLLKHHLFLLYANNTFKGDKNQAHAFTRKGKVMPTNTEVLFSIFHQISRWNVVMQSTPAILLEARHGWRKGFHAHAAEFKQLFIIVLEALADQYQVFPNAQKDPDNSHDSSYLLG